MPNATFFPRELIGGVAHLGGGSGRSPCCPSCSSWRQRVGGGEETRQADCETNAKQSSRATRLSTSCCFLLVQRAKRHTLVLLHKTGGKHCWYVQCETPRSHPSAVHAVVARQPQRLGRGLFTVSLCNIRVFGDDGKAVSKLSLFTSTPVPYPAATASSTVGRYTASALPARLSSRIWERRCTDGSPAPWLYARLRSQVARSSWDR